MNDFDEDESSQASSSTNATTTDQGCTSSSSSSKHTHNHPNAHHHPCGNKATCEEKGDKDHPGEPGKGHCLCCYCEVFGHGGPSAAPVSKNYPEMRERLRLLLSKKNKCKQQQPQQSHKIHNNSCLQNDQNRLSSSSSKSSNASSKSSSVARCNAGINRNHNSTYEAEKSSSTLVASRNEKICESQSIGQLQNNAVPNVRETNKCSDTSTITGKNNLSNSSSRSSMVSHSKHTANQIEKECQIDSLKEIKCTTNEHKTNEHAIRTVGDMNISQQESKIKDVDELLDYIEGNQKAVANDKKKAKKERQKQQKIEELRKKEEEEKKLREEKEKERRRLEQEKKKIEEEERLRLKKMNKKAAQKAKKLAAKGISGETPSDLITAENISSSGNNGSPDQAIKENLDPIQTLEHLKAQHLKELQQLQLLHRQQLEEEHKKLIQRQDEQLSPQCELQQKEKKNQPSKKDRNKKFDGSKVIDKSVQEANSAIKLSNSVQAEAYKTLAEASKNPGNQIKITRMPNGGVEFSTVPAGQEQITSTLQGAPPPMMTGQSPAPPPYLHEIFSRNPSMQPHIPQSGISQNNHSNNNANISESTRPCVPSLSNQPMVTIRRVENPNCSDPTVTISMKEKEQLKEKRDVQNTANSDHGGHDKLLYTLVNGKILKSNEAPDNVLTQATTMPTNMKQFQQRDPNVTEKSKSVMGTSFGGNGSKPSRAPLPLDAYGKVDLNRLELPSGISITKIDGQAPERKYFPSKPSENNDQNILPLPGQHESQRSMLNNLNNSRINGANLLQPSTYPVDNLGQYNIPGIGPTNPNNVIVVDTSSLADNTNSSKTGTSQTGEKSNRKNKKKSKLSQQQSQTAAQMTTPSPQMAKKSQINSCSFTQQHKSNIQSIKSSQNTDRGIGEAFPSSTSSTGSDLKSGPQVLIKNVNGRVVITPVPGTGASMPQPSLTSNKVEQNKKPDKWKGTSDQLKMQTTIKLDKNTNRNSLSPASSEIYANKQNKVASNVMTQQHPHPTMNVSNNPRSNQFQTNISYNKTEMSSYNGIDITCEQPLKNENTNLLLHLAKDKQDNGTALNFGSNQIHNKLSKSANDVGNVGGRKRSKKSSIGDNFEDLSKYFKRKNYSTAYETLS